jgi:amino acid permease
MSLEDLGLPSREELLSGGLAPGRRATALLFAIESRTARLVVESQELTAVHLTERAFEQREHAFLEALAEGRDLPVQPTIQDLEFHAPHWTPLVSDVQVGVRAALAHQLGQKYLFTRQAVPGVRAALDLDTEAVEGEYQRLYGQPLPSIYAPEITFLDRVRWAWTALAKRLDALPPFWIACALTLIIGGVTLALPIAAAGIGALPSIVLIIFFGLVSVVTISAMAETVTRSGGIRYGNVFIGRLVADYLGNTSSSILSIFLTAFSFGLLLVFYLGIATTLEDASGLPTEGWMVVLFLVSLYFLSRGSLNSTLAFSMVITVVILSLLLILSLLAFTHLDLDNLLYVNLPLLNNQPFNPSLWSAIIGVVLGTFSAHILVVVFGKLNLQRDPSGRSLTRGHAAGICFATAINCVWVLAVNGAIPPQVLANQSGTSLVPLTTLLGPAAGVLGAVFVVLSMGLGLIHFSLALFNLAKERLTSQRATSLGPRGRFLISLSPVLVVFLLAEGLFISGRGSYTGLLGLLGVLVDTLMTGIFPVLLLVASRRKGELVPEVIHRRLGHPVLLVGVYMLYLLILLFHGLVIWQNPAQRALGVFVGLLVLGVTINLIRQGGFAPRLVLELRDDQRRDGRSLFAITAGGQPLTADVWLGYGEGEQHVLAATGEVTDFASLRSTTFQLPATEARELKVWAHQITPEESAQCLPALLNVHCGNQEQEIDLQQSDGQVVLPISGEACRLEVTLPEVTSA